MKEDPESVQHDGGRKHTKKCAILVAVQLFPWILSVIVTVLYIFTTSSRNCDCAPRFQDETYSPVQHLVEPQNVVFKSGFDYGKTIYQGPSTPERDKAWEDLYNFGVSRIPKSSAARLVNKTVPIPGDEGHYIVALSVFHHLHCVNMLRKRLWSVERTNNTDELMGMPHLSHCLDALRQTVMCSADITPIPWVWDSEVGEAKGALQVQHTCRNFEKLRQWGLENRVKEFNRKIHVEDDLDRSNQQY